MAKLYIEIYEMSSVNFDIFRFFFTKSCLKSLLFVIRYIKFYHYMRLFIANNIKNRRIKDASIFIAMFFLGIKSNRTARF